MTLAAVALASLAVCSGAAANHGLVDVVSVGTPSHDAFFSGASVDGTRMFFATDQQVLPGDTDERFDIYERVGNVISLVSIGPTGGNGAFHADFAANNSDGSRVFFETPESLVPEDTAVCSPFGACRDVYERSGSTTTLISTGPTSGNPTDADFVGMSEDGTRVFFTTGTRLVAADTDTQVDIYERSGGTTALVSTGPNGGNGGFGATFAGASADGTRVFFTTRESLVASDTDVCSDVPPSCVDIYERSAGTTQLVSTGPGTPGSFNATFGSASADGTRVFFTTPEKLATADSDDVVDVYERAGGVTSLLSIGPLGGNANNSVTFGGISQDGGRAFFMTAERLASADIDGSVDVYERSAGITTLVSTGPVSGGHGPVTFRGASADGSHVFFTTQERLAVEDDDAAVVDVYERHAGITSLVSYGSLSGVNGAPALFEASSDDGTRVFFRTTEALGAFDTDNNDVDIYERAGGGTTMISTGPRAEDGGSPTFQQTAVFRGLTPTGTRVFFDYARSLVSSDTDSSRDAYVAILSYPRPQAASSVRAPLVPAFSACTAANRQHGPPLAFGSCNPPTQVSTSVTLGTPDANGAAANFDAFVRMRVTGAPDLSIAASITDVRCQGGVTTCGAANIAGGNDYVGELRGTTALRLTDRLSGPPPADVAQGTVTDTPFSFDLSCTQTASTDQGGTCSATTSANALTPGAVQSGARAIWGFGPVQVLDGGPDGDTATAPNKVFAAQGVFVP